MGSQQVVVLQPGSGVGRLTTPHYKKTGLLQNFTEGFRLEQVLWNNLANRIWI
jgi:hypothetical protein